MYPFETFSNGPTADFLVRSLEVSGTPQANRNGAKPGLALTVGSVQSCCSLPSYGACICGPLDTSSIFDVPLWAAGAVLQTLPRAILGSSDSSALVGMFVACIPSHTACLCDL